MAKRQVITRQVIDDDQDVENEENQDEKLNEGVSLFALGDVAEKKIERIHLFRHDPDEGFLGEMPPTATEADIKAKYGGSLYRMEAKNGQGRVVKVRHLRIAGDPIFVSESVERRWRKQNGLPVDGAQAVSGDKSLSIQEVLLLFEERDEKRRREQAEKEDRERRERADKEERDRRDREEREMRLRKEEEDREDRRRKDAEEREERRRRQQAEDDERRARQHREDMERAKADTEKLLQQQQVMFSQTLAIVKAENQKAAQQDPVEMLVKGISLARELGGGAGPDGEPANPLSLLLGRAPEILSEIRQTATAAIREAKGKDPLPEENDEGEEDGAPAADQGVTFKGTGAKLLRAVAAKMMKEGKDPEREFMKMAASYLRTPGAASPSSGTAPATSTPAPRRVPAPVRRRKVGEPLPPPPPPPPPAPSQTPPQTPPTGAPPS